MTFEEQVAAAIMRAYFSRPVDEQTGITCSVLDQIDLARAAIDEVAKLFRRNDEASVHDS